MINSKEFIYERLHENLVTLKLNRTHEIIDNYLERATKEDKSLIESLDYLMEEERKYKDDISLEIRVKVAGFPYKKNLNDFDFKFQPSIDKKVINELQSMRFIHNRENVIFLGAPGVGKFIFPTNSK
jgi:DNA replication protein DnaC